MQPLSANRKSLSRGSLESLDDIRARVIRMYIQELMVKGDRELDPVQMSWIRDLADDKITEAFKRKGLVG